MVFTPAPLAARAERQLAEQAPAGSTLLDPACGEGALLAAGAASGHWGDLLGLEREAASARRAAEILGPHRIRNADALAPSTSWPPGAWILANPPWVSFSGRQAAAEAELPTDTAGWPSLHGAFLERIARYIAAESTGAVVLLPASLVELDGYAPLRARVERWARPARVHELGESAFPGVIEPAVQLLLLPRETGAAIGPWLQSEASKSLEAAFAGHPRLPARSFADPGVHSGNSAKQIVRPARETQHESLAQGRDLAPYNLGPPSARLRTDLRPTPDRRFRIAARERYEGFPVLLRQTANRPLAALHIPPTYFRNSLLACRPVEGLDPAFIVAVLNSATAGAWHRARFRDARQKAFPQVKVGHLATQPFPIAHRDADPELHDEVAGRVRALDPDGPHFERERAAIESRVELAFGLAPAVAELVRELA